MPTITASTSSRIARIASKGSATGYAQARGFSAVACYSFFATKNLSCGEGGAIAFDDTALLEKLRLLRLHGMNKSSADRHREGYTDWDMTVLGWKYNMSNIEAAILLPQFDRLERNLERRHKLAAYYEERLTGLNRVRLQAVPPDVVHARHLFAICVDCADRTRLVQELRQEGVECVVNYRPIHLMTFFRERFDLRAGMFPAAEEIGATTISAALLSGHEFRADRGYSSATRYKRVLARAWRPAG